MKPKMNHVLTAIQYWGLLHDVADYFQSAEMPVVKQHLGNACAEIDRIWMENDFDGGQRA